MCYRIGSGWDGICKKTISCIYVRTPCGATVVTINVCSHTHTIGVGTIGARGL